MHLAAILSRYFLLVFFLILIGCRTADNYKLLSFFFDGVPGPVDQKEKVVIKDKKKRVQRKPRVKIIFLSSHPDYKKKRCYSCHNQSRTSSLKTSKQDLCFTCHKQEKFNGDYVHGPVAVKKCLVCHLPHNSKFKKLLIKSSNELCIDCHIKKKEETPDTCEKGKECTSCHDPHISENRYFLKNKQEKKDSK